MAHLKSWLAVVLVGAGALAAAGCCGSENKAASRQCANSGKNVTSCTACCKSVTGKSSASYSDGGGCKCY